MTEGAKFLKKKKKKMAARIWAKISPKTRFLQFSQVWFGSLVFRDTAYNDSLQ